MATAKIKDCFVLIQNGANIKQDKNSGGIPITRIETISNDRFNRDKMGYAGIDDASTYSRYILEDGDILMSHINSTKYLGRAVAYKKIGNETIIHGMNLLRLKADRNKIIPDYAEYYFSFCGFKSKIASITKKAVNQASFSIRDLQELTIDLPDISEQKKISSRLKAIRKTIDIKRSQINRLDDLIKARFVEMFGGEIGDIPFDDVLVDNTKNGFKLDSSNYANDGEVAIVDQGQKLVCGYTKTRHEKKPWTDESIIFGDHTEIVKFVNFPFYLGADGTKLLSPKDGWNARFLYHYLDINYHKRLGYMRHFKYLKEITFIKPDMKKQIKFTTFCDRVDKSKFAVQKSLEKTQLLFDSLMQEYFG